MLLSGSDIRAREGMIVPFMERHKAHGTSAGLSVAGYDLRLGNVFMIPTEVVDGDYCFQHHVETSDAFVLAPGGFVLAQTIERLEIPNNLIGLLKDKSTWARRGISVFNTVFEPGWHGVPTLEIVNLGPWPVRLPIGCGISQMIFQQTSGETEGYAGKYQDQAGVTEAKDG